VGGPYPVATLFSSAFSTSLDSHGGLAVPLAVQQRLEQQEQLLSAHADLVQSLALEVCEMEAVMVNSDVRARQELASARAAVADRENGLSEESHHAALEAALRRAADLHAVGGGSSNAARGGRESCSSGGGGSIPVGRGAGAGACKLSLPTHQDA